jgi:hypothetical protein
VADFIAGSPDLTHPPPLPGLGTDYVETTRESLPVNLGRVSHGGMCDLISCKPSATCLICVVYSFDAIQNELLYDLARESTCLIFSALYFFFLRIACSRFLYSYTK